VGTLTRARLRLEQNAFSAHTCKISRFTGRSFQVVFIRQWSEEQNRKHLRFRNHESSKKSSLPSFLEYSGLMQVSCKYVKILLDIRLPRCRAHSSRSLHLGLSVKSN